MSHLSLSQKLKKEPSKSRRTPPLFPHHRQSPVHRSTRKDAKEGTENVPLAHSLFDPRPSKTVLSVISFESVKEDKNERMAYMRFVGEALCENDDDFNATHKLVQDYGKRRYALHSIT